MPGRQRLFGGEEAPGQRHFAGESGAAAKIQQRPVFRAAEPARCLGHLELGPGLGDDQVAFQHDPKCQAHRVAVRRGNDRLPVDRSGQQIGGIGAPALRPAMLQELLSAAQLTLMHIGAARKGAAGAADDRDLRFRIEIEAAQRIRQMPHQIVAEGVEPIRPVQGQGRDPIRACIFDQVLGCRYRPFSCSFPGAVAGSPAAIALRRAACAAEIGARSRSSSGLGGAHRALRGLQFERRPLSLARDRGSFGGRALGGAAKRWRGGCVRRFLRRPFSPAP